MEKRELLVYIRSQSGKGFSRKLRGQGLIPGVLYGPKTDPHQLWVALVLNEELEYSP